MSSQSLATLFFLLVITPICFAEETISLSEIQPGDAGEWRTVVSGTEVEAFPLEVVGIIESFVGPGMPIILCRATDLENTHVGPVSGMSGSPVYIGGRLAGAYAYGFPWSKEKTLIGVTPIEWMDPLLSYPDVPYRETQDSPLPPPARNASLGIPSGATAVQADAASSSTPLPLPIPLLTSGLSSHALSAIGPWLEKKNIYLTAGAGGRAQEDVGKFEAGSPLAVILASGDLTLAGVGTITRREGDRIIAFGHPMLGSGSVELPVGSAEIVDVVASYRISFKLSNVGEVAGTLWQDSSPGIQAELGRIPYMVPITVSSDAAVQSPVVGKLAEHRRLIPAMALAYAAQTLLTSQEGPADSTVRGNLRLSIEGVEEPLELSRVGVGFGGAIDILFSFADNLNTVLNGTQEFPRLKNIEIDFQTNRQEQQQLLHSIRLESSRIRPGEEVPLTITTRKRGGEVVRHSLSVPLPQAPPGSSFSLLVADANAIRSHNGFHFNTRARSLDELLNELGQLRDNGSIYVQLLRPNPGLRLDGHNLEDLPPSVLRLYQSSLEKPGEMLLRESVVWETSIPVPGAFSGSSRIEFTTEN